MNENKTNINWFPGHMAKTKRQISENLNLIDIIYEVIDSRIPYSSKIKDIDELIKNKKRILIFTKKDLCDINKTNKWIKYYEDKGYKCLLVDLTNNKDYKRIIDLTNELMKDYLQSKKDKGINNYTTKVLVIGIPNVGKSTLINTLVGKTAAQTGNKPGVTKSINWLKTKYNITLLDTPGILWPKLDEKRVALNLAATSAIKQEVLNITDIGNYLLEYLCKNYPEKVIERYKITIHEDTLENYYEIGKRTGLIKNDEPLYREISIKLYNDIVSGRIKGVTLDDRN